MTFLVTGCAGFIGSHLCESLLADGHSVIGVDCFNNNYGRADKLRNLEQALQWKAFDFVPADLSRGDLEDLVADCDGVAHLAAEPGVRASWGRRFETYIRNNVTATQHILETLKNWPEKRLVYASSSSVYGQADQFPTAETAPTEPRSPYGVTKLAAEHLVQLYRHNCGLSTVCLRYFSVFGPRQRPDMAFARFCHAALAREPLVVYGDGTQTRDFTFVQDVVSATRAGLESPHSGLLLNIGGGSRISLRQAIDVIEDLAGRPLEVQYVRRERGDVQDTGAATDEARRQLGYRPSTPFVDGLRSQFEWLSERHSLAAGASHRSDAGGAARRGSPWAPSR